MQDNFYTKEEARTKLFAGIKKVSDVVGATMGTGGSNALIEAIENPGHLLTNDGITVAQSMVLADPIEDMGRKILLESISRANKASGDGSSTTAVLTAAIIEEGMKHLSEASPMEIKRALEACMPLIEQSINDQKRDITVDEVGQVATISAEDESIGQTIQNIYKEIGKDGLIHWDVSKTFEDYYTIGKGITIEGAGIASPYMADLDEAMGFKKEVRWKNAKVLIVKQKITSSGDFNALFGELDSKGTKEIVIFCDEYEANVVADFVKTRAVKGFKTVMVKMPTFWKDWWYADLAVATGATIIDQIAGVSLKNMNVSHLGEVGNIIVTATDTYLDGIKDVQGHVESLLAEETDEGKLRASRLNTKTARYFVGAASDSALSYRRLKVEDAISAAYQALQGGIVIGGGLALVNATNKIKNDILRIALCAPFEQIKKNMGSSFSAKDMEEQKVYDPANIVLNAARNAISVAAAVLTTSVVIQLPRQSVTEQLVQELTKVSQRK